MGVCTLTGAAVMRQMLQFATSSIPAFTRLGTAAFVGDGVENFKRPEKMLELYEFQGQ
jgi:hypothetical protein